MTRNPMFDLDEDDADARAVDRAYDNAREAPGPVHRIPAIDAVRAELRAAVRERDALKQQLDDARAIETSLRAEIAQLRGERAPVEPTPAPVATGCVMLKYGTLPTHSMLFGACKSTGSAVSAVDARAILRGLLARERHDDARRLLNSLGFDWLPLAGCACGGSPCVCSDVAAVGDALAGGAAVGMPGEGVAVDETEAA